MEIKVSREMLTIKVNKLLGMIFLSTLASKSIAQSNEVDFSDPTSIYSQAGIAAGTEGVDVKVGYGGYLGGFYKHKLTVEAKNDWDYFNVDYMLFNTATDTGFLFDSTWSQEYAGNSVDKASMGVIKKLAFAGDKLHVYPSLNLGLMWGDYISSTTFLEVDAPVTYTINKLWLGVTPSYVYSLNGENVKEFETTFDVGYHIAPGVGISGHANLDGDVWANFVFAF
jgi:hypothetical protein